MATRQYRLGEFEQDSAPPGEPLEVLCEDHVGTYLLPYLCLWRDGMSIRSASVKNVAQFWLAVLLCLTVCSGVADAKTIKVFALGASNTNGKGVGSDRAWPAQLERILRAKGYDATVTVNAVNGDTSEGVLRRANSIPTGTQVVVFDTGGDNDHRRGRTENDINATKARIVSAIRAHGAVPIQAPYRTLIGPLRSGGAAYQADGHHLTAKSHGRVASFLASKVLAAVR